MIADPFPAVTDAKRTSSWMPIRREFVHALDGDHLAAILLDQFHFWSKLAAANDWWVQKTHEQIEEDTGITKKQATRIIQRLTNLGLVQTRRKPSPGQGNPLQYRLLPAFEEWAFHALNADPKVTKGNVPKSEVHKTEHSTRALSESDEMASSKKVTFGNVHVIGSTEDSKEEEQRITPYPQPPLFASRTVEDEPATLPFAEEPVPGPTENAEGHPLPLDLFAMPGPAEANRAASTGTSLALVDEIISANSRDLGSWILNAPIHAEPNSLTHTDGPAYSEDFERCFWKPWPDHGRKKAKGAAYKSWLKLKPSPALAERIRQAIEEQKNGTDWNKDHGRWIPMPVTWLNQGRWDDTVVPWTKIDAVFEPKSGAQAFKDLQVPGSTDNMMDIVASIEARRKSYASN